MTHPHLKIWIPVTLVALLAVTGLTLARSTAGQRMMLNTGIDTLEKKTGYRLSAEDVAGTWPWHVVLTGIKLADSKNNVATISDLDLRWSPLRALTGAIRVKSLSLGEVRVNIAQSEAEGTGEPLLIPTLNALPDVEVRDITVTSLVLINSEGVASEAFVLSGQSETAPGRVEIEMAFLPHDASRTQDQATFEFEYDRGKDTFSLSTDIDLHRNGILDWLGAKGIPASISITTESEGPASSWQARNTFGVGNFGSGTLVVSCNCLAGKDISFSGTFDPQDLDLSYLPFSTSQPFTFVSNLAYDKKTKRLTVSELGLETSGARLEADLEVLSGDQTWHLSGEGRLMTRDGVLAENGLSPLFWSIGNLRQSETAWQADTVHLETLRGFVEAASLSATSQGAYTSDLHGAITMTEFLDDPGLKAEFGETTWSAHINFADNNTLEVTNLKAASTEGAILLVGEIDYNVNNKRLGAELEINSASPFEVGDLSIPTGQLLNANVNLNHAVHGSNLAFEATLGRFNWRSFRAPPAEITGRLEDWVSGKIEDLKGNIRLQAKAPSTDISSLKAQVAFRPETAPACGINSTVSASGNYAGIFSVCLNSRTEEGLSLWDGLLTAKNFHGGALSGETASFSLSQNRATGSSDWQGHVASEGLAFSSIKIAKLDTVFSLRKLVSSPEVTVNSARVVHQDTAYSLQDPVTFKTGDGTLSPITILSDTEGSLTVENLKASSQLSGHFEAKNFKIPVLPARMSGEATVEATPRHQDGHFNVYLEPQSQEYGKISLNVLGAWNGTNIDGVATLGLAVPGKEEEPLQIAKFQVPVEARFHDRVTFTRSGAASASLAYDGSVARLLAFAPLYDHTVDGILKVNASLREDEGIARWQGHAALENGLYTHKGQGIHVEGVRINADLQGTERNLESIVTISQIDPQNNKETLTGRGELSIQSLQEWQGNLNLHLDDNSLLQHPNYHGVLSGNLSLTATPAQAFLEGHIRANRVEASIPPPSGFDIVELNVIPVDADGNPLNRPEREQGTILLPKLQLSVELEADEQIFVRGRGVDSEWSAKLALTGSSDLPLVDGQFTLRRGHLIFGGRTFEFESGSVTVNGAQYANPSINLVARHKVDNAIEARIVVAGRASSPTVHFESTPPLPEEDIVSYVLFGKPVIELGPMEALRTTVALAQISGRASFGTSLFDLSRQAIGVDVLQFTPPGGASGEGASLTVGKYVTSGVFLSVTEDFGSQTRSAGVELKITDTISVGAKVDEASETEAVVEWRRDY